jgi:hypothetical protein
MKEAPQVFVLARSAKETSQAFFSTFSKSLVYVMTFIFDFRERVKREGVVKLIS